MKKYNVESFNLDHTKVEAPFIRLAGTVDGANGDKVHKYDLRFKQPNKTFLKMPVMHTLEHLMAENMRNHYENVIDLSPMGCQTGFYLTVFNDDNSENIAEALEKTLHDVLEATEIPAQNEVQCGFAKSHDLDGAKNTAQEMLDGKDAWHQIFAE
ncbi:S-ribosylhomocysteine lyase [Phocicoccus schoeneichii]|uniref:S-ribosylhomocysteine lyase n=1 Tax=Phocicoccus schoeneichii TaxID=1812261 RepID=A0A6V7RMP0_9BACL|nr:S-ribosylhomocysteine lyase [Jeotgalicoccus schoeneichii]GGH55689.1 S-ribosylhomocysteine lyase [Jeotgalicoccus schoeneichii]CAD2079440.1 S-ribosylhomocysteine lyase [Jeotgalicoccus schoeneichii]